MPPAIRIRRTADLELIKRLDKTCFGDEDSLAEVLGCSDWWVAESRAGSSWAPAGYAGASLSDGDVYLFLSRAGVLPAARGAGLQRKLINVRLKHGRALGCSHAWTYTSTNNIRSQRSLIATGFRPYAYEHDEDFAGIYFKRAL